MRYLVFIPFMVFASCDKRCYTCTTTTLTNAGVMQTQEVMRLHFVTLPTEKKLLLKRRGLTRQLPRQMV